MQWDRKATETSRKSYTDDSVTSGRSVMAMTIPRASSVLTFPRATGLAGEGQIPEQVHLDNCRRALPFVAMNALDADDLRMLMAMLGLGRVVLPTRRIQAFSSGHWRLPDGAVKVGVGSRWANPFGRRAKNAQHAVELFVDHLRRRPDLVVKIRAELAGLDLACWCPLVDEDGEPFRWCHGDVLLRVARGEQP